MSSRLKRLIYALTFVALLVTGGGLFGPMRRLREEYDLSAEPSTGLTPQAALATQMLGWGRGLIIDVIWIRMEAMKQQERLFELVQLADWATKLAPGFPQVWDLQSWNLAYNVSTKVYHLPDRWAWVRSGLELLRDEGIPQNPHSPLLYSRLAMTYFHKIGEQDDNAHMFYKQQFGLLMHEVLGGEGPEPALELLAAAPLTREELLLDPDTLRFWTECNEYGFDIVDGYFEWFKGTPSVPLEVRQLIEETVDRRAIVRIAVFSRAKRLRDEYRLEPERMLALTRKYGPFDWRSAFPHAIYWAELGLEELDALEARTLGAFEAHGIDPKEYIETQELYEEDKFYEFERISLERIIYACLQSLVHHGRLVFDMRGRLMMEPGTDYRFADVVLPLYEKVIEAHGLRFQVGTRDAYRNFLSRGIMEFDMMGDRKTSMRYFNILKAEFPDEVEGTDHAGFKQWFFDNAQEQMTASEARRQTVAMLRNAFFYLAGNHDDAAAVHEELAKRFARNWNRESEQNLRGMVRYSRLKEAVLSDILTGVMPFSDDLRANLVHRLREEKGDKATQDMLDRILHRSVGPLEGEEVEEGLKQETL